MDQGQKIAVSYGSSVPFLSLFFALFLMKLVISDPKTGKAYQKELSEEEAQMFYGKKIGDKIDLSPIGLKGYVVEIRGGTDKDGFPMRPDVHGVGRKRVLISSGPGVRKLKKGERRRKTVRGNTVAEDIAQLNVKVVEYGERPLEEILGGKEEGEAQAGGS